MAQSVLTQTIHDNEILDLLTFVSNYIEDDYESNSASVFDIIVLFKFFVLYSKYFTLITHKFKHTENLKKKKIKSYFLNLIKINQKNLNLLVLSKLIITFS